MADWDSWGVILDMEPSHLLFDVRDTPRDPESKTAPEKFRWEHWQDLCLKLPLDVRNFTDLQRFHPRHWQGTKQEYSQTLYLNFQNINEAKAKATGSVLLFLKGIAYLIPMKDFLNPPGHLVVKTEDKEAEDMGCIAIAWDSLRNQNPEEPFLKDYKFSGRLPS